MRHSRSCSSLNAAQSAGASISRARYHRDNPCHVCEFCNCVALHIVVISSVTTLSPTQARVNLSSLLRRAANGEDIGILHGGQVIALRPVTVHSDDYAFREYGVTQKEIDLFVRRTDAQIKRDRKAGKMKRYTGNLETDLAG